ncbi:putative GnaT-family acetyltransferase [Cupriavidus taiwanensis]|uniref:GnaT-family acetyltransferase n=1 Tax=Cupriavidus taiwanensis TaxID=164546 RepID=A0A375E7K6_9BURK|nr:GNAT family N-acetyltransferase [Cupriavidus taiwanensis]SOZ64428.1 putative GnaT-family acetyltransferase [Cupriavidus taiwanensis]SOZ65136.1 putative GnaT-family acetyltransferase [Cupriavidus taiwanensis]SOZ68803.1 putative GnaT-family acetyltransferase [Cupriavidus taiwanensis]SPA08229.1 putative GnaT-family acetyltransferase [Cupriavidus taiwanensis]
MGSELALRTAQAGDHEWIVAAHGEVYATEFGFDGRFQDGIARKMQAIRQLSSPFNRIWVGWVGDQRAASIAISERPGSVAFLNFVLVLPRYRGSGAGRALMSTALDHARAHALKEVQLETYSCLVDARALYRRLGFRTTQLVPAQAAFGRTFDQEFWALSL